MVPHIMTYSVTFAGVVEVILDRRLSRDDRRGLGHGVSDNKVTLSSFRLLVEHRSSPDHNVSHTVLLPDCILLQLQVHNILCNPIANQRVILPITDGSLHLLRTCVTRTSLYRED